MHELAITKSIVDIALETAKKNDARRIKTVTIRIGELSGVVPEAVQFCYDVCVQGTAAEGSQLIVERVEASAYCENCQQEIRILQLFESCPICQDYRYRLTKGQEMDVKDMEVE